MTNWYQPHRLRKSGRLEALIQDLRHGLKQGSVVLDHPTPETILGLEVEKHLTVKDGVRPGDARSLAISLERHPRFRVQRGVGAFIDAIERLLVNYHLEDVAYLPDVLNAASLLTGSLRYASGVIRDLPSISDLRLKSEALELAAEMNLQNDVPGLALDTARDAIDFEMALFNIDTRSLNEAVVPYGMKTHVLDALAVFISRETKRLDILRTVISQVLYRIQGSSSEAVSAFRSAAKF